MGIPQKERCHCTVQDFITCDPTTKLAPLVEVRQYPDYDGADTTIVNRGIRALCNIKQGSRLGIYVGDIIPVDFNEKWYFDPIYCMGFRGPSEWKQVKGTKGAWSASEKKTCDVSSAWNGNWTRFLNHTEKRMKHLLSL
jgi:hypothetical protein